MIKKYTLFASVFLLIILLNGCKKTSCPSDMHEEKLDNGQTICVPNNFPIAPKK